MESRTGERILLIRLSAIGDVTVTTPVTRALREAKPDAHITWVVETRAKDVLAGNPYLDEVITWDRPKGGLGIRPFLELVPQLRARRFDWAIDFQGLMRSALVARFSGARRVVGNAGAREGAERLYHVRVPRREDDPSSRQRCLDLLRPLGVRSANRDMVLPISESDRMDARALLHTQGVTARTPYVCLVPFTTWTQKHWFSDRWSELAELIDRRLGLRPVVLGSGADAPGAAEICARAGATVNLAGKTTLKSASAVIAGAALTVAVDTALMHASVAVGTPTVALCGASWWRGFEDYRETGRYTMLREELGCSPCLRAPTCGGQFDCMRALTVERVFQAARERLGSTILECV
ncbi:MAG: glycosyltransferase family 9 protein [Armatimonadota bacterium]